MNGTKFKNCGHAMSFSTPRGIPPSPISDPLTSKAPIEQEITDKSTNSTDQLDKTGSKMKIENDFETNLQRSKYLFESGLMSDVVFVFNDDDTKKQEKINCHKLILATRSRVFYKLFNEPISGKSLEIKIIDVKAKDFKNILRYIYYDDIDLDIQSFVSTFMAAEKYAIKTLSKSLIQKIKYLDGDETCIMLKHLENHKITNKDFQKELIKKFEIETKQIIKSNQFLNFKELTIKELLSNSILNADEIEIFNAILKWAKHQCANQGLLIDSINLKKILSNLIYLFRYKSMNLDQFANGPAKYRLLNDNEIVDLFLYFSLKNDSIELPKSLIQSKRICPTVYNVEFINFDSYLSRRRHRIRSSNEIGTNEEIECINFRSNQEIYLRGAIISYSNELANKSNTNLLELEISKKKIKNQIKDNNNNSISIKQIKIDFNKSKDINDQENSNNCYRENSIEFDYPILIQSNVDYTISLFYGKGFDLDFKKCIEKASSANVTFEFESEDGLSLLNKLIFNKF